jgi:DNA replication initiation complex subunit (GINS family)
MDTTYLTKFEITIESKNNQLTTDEEKELFDYIKQRIEGKDVKIPEKLIDCVVSMKNL